MAFVKFVEKIHQTKGQTLIHASLRSFNITSSYINFLCTCVCVTGDDKCKRQRVGITLTNETWKQSLLNRDSTEFKNLESNVLSAVCIQ